MHLTRSVLYLPASNARAVEKARGDLAHHTAEVERVEAALARLG